MNIPYTYIEQLKKLPVISQGAIVPGGGKDPKFNQAQGESERRRAELKEDTNTLSAFQKLILDVNSPNSPFGIILKAIEYLLVSSSTGSTE